MADEFDTTTQDDDWSVDAVLREFEPEVEEAEKDADNEAMKVAKKALHVSAHEAKRARQDRIDRMVGDFYEKASEDEKKVADILLAGIAEETKVKQALDLAKAKAQAMSKSEEEASEEDEEAATEKSFAAPVASAHQSPKDPWEPVLERARAGDTHSSFLEFMADDDAFPMPVARRR